MAKGSAMGIWRGRKGSSVFYYIKNSNNAQKQGIRERRYEVSNPKSYAQAGQRMKLLAVQRFYNQMKDVLQRGWEGESYGTPTRQKFLKYALKTDLAKIAALPKDATIVPPSELLVSHGSLCECSLFKWENPDGSQGAPRTPLCHIACSYLNGIADGPIEDGNPIPAETVAKYVENGGKEGDQITVLFCTRDSDRINYGFYSFIMAANEVVPNNIIHITSDNVDGTYCFVVGGDENNVLAGAAIIISREDGTKHLRSTSTFYPNRYMLNDFFSNASRLNARRSYMKSEVLNNDWPADPEETTDGEGNVQGTVTVINLSPGHGNTPAQQVANAGDIITLTVVPAANYSAFWYSERDAVNLIGRGNTLEWTVQPGQQQLFVEFVGNDQP